MTEKSKGLYTLHFKTSQSNTDQQVYAIAIDKYKDESNASNIATFHPKKVITPPEIAKGEDTCKDGKCLVTISKNPTGGIGDYEFVFKDGYTGNNLGYTDLGNLKYSVKYPDNGKDPKIYAHAIDSDRTWSGASNTITFKRPLTAPQIHYNGCTGLICSVVIYKEPMNGTKPYTYRFYNQNGTEIPSKKSTADTFLLEFPANMLNTAQQVYTIATDKDGRKSPNSNNTPIQPYIKPRNISFKNNFGWDYNLHADTLGLDSLKYHWIIDGKNINGSENKADLHYHFPTLGEHTVQFSIQAPGQQDIVTTKTITMHTQFLNTNTIKYQGNSKPGVKYDQANSTAHIITNDNGSTLTCLGDGKILKTAASISQGPAWHEILYKNPSPMPFYTDTYDNRYDYTIRHINWYNDKATYYNNGPGDLYIGLTCVPPSTDGWWDIPN